ncbi:hypothetical protein M8A51_25755 [Schlegelella sp. S2-27]|uniref:Uncharacterized protein n=1 Tax=Caldimonas mangrovi TaxID=2944811 RepID=A0ABT0YW11_9BURK|nr:hypothetical protein [Caldimonas mangrovi]MCM5682943.1 hypothetical protein [Caldimonas mangrovi]
MNIRKNKRYRMRLMGLRVAFNHYAPEWLPIGLTETVRTIADDFAKIKAHFDAVLA